MTSEPLIVHPLPAAPTFTGREDELAALRQFWASGDGVLSLIGLGGAGKTALAQRFIQWLGENDPPDALVVWSFYDEPDANAFLQTAYQYLSGGLTADAKGAGWFHLLKDALADGRRILLVLDGLERVQRQRTDASGIYGEMEDPLLRGFLTRICSGAGRSKAVITSRFPVADIDRRRGRGYSIIDVDSLGADAMQRLLQSHGVHGTDAAVLDVLQNYGGHALTLDLLGGALARFHGGDAACAPTVSAELASSSVDREQRLAQVLRLYEERLPARELALLCRLCIFRFGVDPGAVESIFLGAGKESIAGEMAGMSPEELRTALDELQRRHLTLRDGRGRFTIHPAVRDHFYRLFREPQALHDAVRVHLSSLTSRPGIGPPEDKATLDLLEELVFHAIHSGNLRDAEDIYRHRMGGNDHLNALLGEYVRTYRILRAFDECPDNSAMYHCLRAFGRFDDALKWRPQNRYIRLICGKLSELCKDTTDSTRRVAMFLQGHAVSLPERTPDMPLPVGFLHLYRGAAEEARRVAEAERSVSIYQDDIVRNDLALAEADRQEGALGRCRAKLEAASAWILNSGSQEHLCLLHLVRGRLAMDEGNEPGARAALEEGLHTAEESSFDLLRIDLLVEMGRCMLQLARDPIQAEHRAREAVEVAQEPECRFAWGEAKGLHLLGECLRVQGRIDESREALEQALAVRRRIADPAAVVTERALRALGTG